MTRMRGLSTVLGAVISIAAMLSVMAAAAYMLSVMGSTQARIAKLSSQRMNDLLEMYTSLIVNNTGDKLCFYASGDRGLVKSVILLGARRLHVVHGRCVEGLEAKAAKRIILVSRNGALFQLDPRIVTSIKGSAPLYALLTGTETTRATYAGEPVTNLLDYLNETLLAGRLQNETISVKLRLMVAKLGPFDVVAREELELNNGGGVASATLLVPQLTTLNKDLYYDDFGWPQNILVRRTTHYYMKNIISSREWRGLPGLQPRSLQIPLMMRLVKLDNNTVCANMLPLYRSWVDYQGLQIFAWKAFSITVCFRRQVLSGDDITINSTLVWGGTPLSNALFSIVRRYGYAVLRIGPPGGLVPGIARGDTSAGELLYLQAYPANVVDLGLNSYTVPFTQSDTINLAPMVYTPVSVKTEYTTGSGHTVRRVVVNFTATGRVVDGLTRPYIWAVWTPIAVYYKLLYDTSRAPAPLFVMYGTPLVSLKLATLYQPGFITYVEPAPGTQCRLIRLESKPPLIDLNGVERVPGLVCIKMGTYKARIQIYDIYDTRYFATHSAPRIIYTYELPGDIVVCYYPAKLVCKGRVYIYYSFAPSTIFNDGYLRLINELYNTMSRNWINHPEFANIFLVSLEGKDIISFFDRLAKEKSIDVCGLTEIFDFYNGLRQRRTTRIIAPSRGCKVVLPGVTLVVVYSYGVHGTYQKYQSLEFAIKVPMLYAGNR